MELFILYIFLACIASFLSVVIVRLPTNGDLVTARSKCDLCSKKLKWYNLIPIVSWLIFFGKSSCCKQKISIFYLIWEIFYPAIIISIYYYTNSNLSEFIYLSIIVTILLLMFAIDLKHLIIPDSLQIILLSCFCIYSFVSGDKLLYKFLNCLIYSALGIFVYYSSEFFFKKEAIGFGDVKLIGIFGWVLTPLHLGVFFTLSGLIGIISGLIWKYIYPNRQEYPFAPSLIIAFLICLTFPNIYDLM